MDIFATKEVINTFSDPLYIVYILAMASLFGWMIAWTYHKTKSATENKFELESTIIIMTVITALIIMIIGDSVARALGIFGAFSIIRFRTPMKNPRDTAFVFFALSAGLAAGANAIAIGLFGVIFICSLALFLDYSHLFGLRQRDYILTFNVGKKFCSDKHFKEIIERYVNPDMNLKIMPNRNGQQVNFSFSIAMQKKYIINDLVKELSGLDGVSKINIRTPMADIN